MPKNMLQLIASSHATVFSSRASGLSQLRSPEGVLSRDRNVSNNVDRYSGRSFWCCGIRGRDLDRFRRRHSPTSWELRRGSVDLEFLVRAYGWKVRRLDDADGDEMRQVVRIQAKAFHEPTALFNDLFFQFFQVGFAPFSHFQYCGNCPRSGDQSRFLGALSRCVI